MFWFKKRKAPTIDQTKLGVIPDPRPIDEKNRDYKAEEIFEFAPFEWKDKPQIDWFKYPIFNQDRSSSCLAQATAKVLGIENFLEEGRFNTYSAKDIYLQRSNYPSPGMYFIDALKIGHNLGACLEQLMPSQQLNEEIMNLPEDRTPSMKIIASMFRGGSYLVLPKDVDQIASIIEPKGKPVVLGVKFGPNEWNKIVPEILGTEAPYGHGIVGTNATLWNGQKAIVIEDSWGPETGMEGRRILTENWFTAGRVIFAGYFEALNNIGLEEKPKYEFKRDLRFGMRGDEDVKKLQECLAYLKMFPSGVIDFTGNFFGITLKAVLLFQETYKITATGFVGPETRGQLNILFA